MALSMCYVGARDETANQLKVLLNASHMREMDIIKLNKTYLSDFSRQNLSSDVEINIANKIFPKTGFKIKKEFLRIIKDFFRSDVNQLDYSNQPVESANAINRWVAEKTRNKINNIISSGDLNKETKMILINAIYFKGYWAQPFLKNNTLEREFHCIDGTNQKVKMMSLRGMKLYISSPGGKFYKIKQY